MFFLLLRYFFQNCLQSQFMSHTWKSVLLLKVTHSHTPHLACFFSLWQMTMKVKLVGLVTVIQQVNYSCMRSGGWVQTSFVKVWHLSNLWYQVHRSWRPSGPSAGSSSLSTGWSFFHDLISYHPMVLDIMFMPVMAKLIPILYSSWALNSYIHQLLKISTLMSRRYFKFSFPK